MNEISGLDVGSWEALPAERRQEITLILGRMAHRRLHSAVGEEQLDDDRDDGKAVAGVACLG